MVVRPGLSQLPYTLVCVRGVLLEAVARVLHDFAFPDDEYVGPLYGAVLTNVAVTAVVHLDCALGIVELLRNELLDITNYLT